MGIKSISLAFTVLILSSNADAALVTHGYLTSNDDGSSNIISDSLNNVEYLRLDVLADFNYAETLGVLASQDGGFWHIADGNDAVAFTAALLGGATACAHDGTTVTVGFCGPLINWVDGHFGDSHESIADYAWFLDSQGEADSIRIGLYRYHADVLLGDHTMLYSEEFTATGTYWTSPIGWLLVRTPEVPAPAAVWLFGSGLLGLIGVARRKARA